MLNFGTRLAEERKRIGLNQTDFGAIGGVTKTSQVNYESGARSPNVDYWQAIAKTGADVNYILTGVRIPIVQSNAKTEGVDILDDVKKPPTKVVARHLGELGVSEDDLSLARMINRLPEAQKNTKIADIETLLQSNNEAISHWIANNQNSQDKRQAA